MKTVSKFSKSVKKDLMEVTHTISHNYSKVINREISELALLKMEELIGD